MLSILKCSTYSKLTFLKSCSASSLTCFIIFGGLPSSALILSTSKATNFKKKKKKNKNVYDPTNIICFLFKLQNVNLKLKLRKKEKKRKKKKNNLRCHIALEHKILIELLLPESNLTQSPTNLKHSVNVSNAIIYISPMHCYYANSICTVHSNKKQHRKSTVLLFNKKCLSQLILLGMYLI